MRRKNRRLETGPQRNRNSHQIGVLGIHDLQGLSYGRTELLVADMRLLEPDPSGVFFSKSENRSHESLQITARRRETEVSEC